MARHESTPKPTTSDLFKEFDELLTWKERLDSAMDASVERCVQEGTSVFKLDALADQHSITVQHIDMQLGQLGKTIEKRHFSPTKRMGMWVSKHLSKY